MARFGSDPPALPIALDWKDRKLPLMVGPDADDPKARFRLSVPATGELSRRKIRVRLSRKRLEEPKREDSRLCIDVPSGTLRAGKSELALLCDTRAPNSESPVMVHQVFLEVTH